MSGGSGLSLEAVHLGLLNLFMVDMAYHGVWHGMQMQIDTPRVKFAAR